MENSLQLLIGIALSFLPFFELRGGLPILVNYAVNNNLSTLPFFFISLFFNIIAIFFAFFFLDFLHIHLLRFKSYQKISEKFLKRIQRKVDKTKSNFDKYGFLALTLFVAIPFPGTGAWTGSLVAWILGLERKRSYISIALGVLIAGLLIFFTSLGVFTLFL